MKIFSLKYKPLYRCCGFMLGIVSLQIRTKCLLLKNCI